MITTNSWWEKRLSCAHAVIASCFGNSMGDLKGVEPRLAAAIRDLTSKPGSLVRAVSAYLMGIEMGVGEEASRAVACGIEYLHTASLVFDDLPSMDNAIMRRGASCIHIVHGEAIAILAALAMINRGYSLMWQGIRRGRASRRERAGEWVDACLGTHGVIGGQAFDLRQWNGAASAAETSAVAARKTGDLLRLTLVLPAIIGRGTEREIQLLSRIGILRGLAYQAADDLKDVLCSEFETGKTGKRDQIQGRPNLILADGFQAGLRRFKRLRTLGDRAQNALPGPQERWGMLAPLRIKLPTSQIPNMVPVAV
ncbi:MAG: polyprenyl synthetase family protein [Luteolibacter sp.]